MQRNSITSWPVHAVVLGITKNYCAMLSTRKFCFFILLVLLSSCGAGHYNFSKQKFTDLRKLKPVYEDDQYETIGVEGEVQNQQENQPDQPEASAFEIADDQDPKLSMLKQKIENGDQVIIRIKGQHYRLEHAVYDQFYDAIIGQLVPVDVQDILGDYTLVEAEKADKNLGTYTIYSNDIIRIENNEKDVENQIEPTDLESNDSVHKPANKNQMATSVANRSHFQKATSGKKARTAFITGVGGLLIFALGVVLLITFGEFALIVLLLVGYLMAYIGFLSAAIQAHKYKRLSQKDGLKPYAAGQQISFFSWFFLVILSGALLFVPLLLAIVIYFAVRN